MKNLFYNEVYKMNLIYVEIGSEKIVKYYCNFSNIENDKQKTKGYIFKGKESKYYYTPKYKYVDKPKLFYNISKNRNYLKGKHFEMVFRVFGDLPKILKASRMKINKMFIGHRIYFCVKSEWIKYDHLIYGQKYVYFGMLKNGLYFIYEYSDHICPTCDYNNFDNVNKISLYPSWRLLLDENDIYKYYEYYNVKYDAFTILLDIIPKTLINIILSY